MINRANAGSLQLILNLIVKPKLVHTLPPIDEQYLLNMWFQCLPYLLDLITSKYDLGRIWKPEILDLLLLPPLLS